MVEKACKKCRMVVTSDKCPVCQTSDLTASWKGYIMIFNAEKSEIAKKLNINTSGKYALRLGK